MAKAPGKPYQQGISLIDLAEMFPDETAAAKWFESKRWPDGVRCARCNSDRVMAVKSNKPMPWHCKDCRSYFSVKIGTIMERSRLPLRKWAFGVFLTATSLIGTSSMKLHRDLKITQKTAWFMAHRIRGAMETPGGLFAGPVEVDETYIGGKEKNKHAFKKSRAGRDAVGKIAVVGAKGRATNRVAGTSGATLKGFVHENAESNATVYTDDHRGYAGLDNHATVRHSVGEYVNGQAHTNGIESFWAMLKRGYHGTYHHMSGKHLQRYVNEFATRHGLWERDTIDMMGDTETKRGGWELTQEENERRRDDIQRV